MTDTDKEYSAGGVVIHNGRALLIRMKNLAGELVWTFPKGHIEAGETPEAAALREVREETGCVCRITGDLFTAHYNFTRQGRPVEKTVRWFLMKKAGEDAEATTPHEVHGMKWCGAAETEASITYPSDKELFSLVKSLLSLGDADS